MIVGIGHDIVDIRRVEKIITRHNGAFLDKYFSRAEADLAVLRGGNEKGKPPQKRADAATLAKRFAAKEAAVKALGTGFRNGLYLKNISVELSADGKPHLHFTDKAIDILGALMPYGYAPQTHLSITDEYPYASAYVIIEAVPLNT